MSDPTQPASSDASEVPFESEEWKRIHERRRKAFPDTEPPADPESRPEHLIGLALSGGGLRSALFNDGFLQGLSHVGFLRYVDFLCSVSGGGYIAGHLATRATPPDEKPRRGFHDETDRSGKPKWWLGRSPATGQVDENRMRGVGRYLASKFSLTPSFLWSLTLSLLVYAGIVGVVATTLALFWRSFDDPMFRVLLRSVLDFKFGGELAIAFYPTLIVLIGWFVVALLGWVRDSKHQRTINRTGLTLFLAAVCISVAVFIGNGKTDVSRDGAASLRLNHYAQWLAIAAAALQLIAFVGRESLFRSERDEAKRWQKAAQQVATTGVILFACFAMVHFMAREDISGYTSHRSPHLVRGDVSDWDLLQRIHAGYQVYQSSLDGEGDEIQDPTLRDLDVTADIARASINHPDLWTQHQLTHPLITLRDDDWSFLASTPTRPLDELTAHDEPAWSFWRRLLGVFEAYYVTFWTPEDVTPDTLEEAIQEQSDELKSVSDYHTLAHYRWQQQRIFLDDFNRDLEHPQFTDYLLRLRPVALKNPKDESLPANLKRFIAHARIRNPTRSSQPASSDSGSTTDPASPGDDVASLLDGGLLRSELEDDDVQRKRLYAAGNRDLMSSMFPKVVQDIDVASTLIVPPYDQQSRYRWLLLWWLFLCLGICLSAIRNQSSTIYMYYRDRLSKLFLNAGDDDQSASAYRGSTPLHRLCPTADGLPHPLFLAARLRPCMVEDTYRVRSEPFVFSPVYCGDRDQEVFHTTEVGLPGVGERSIWIGDAVTISGAAVSPLMTNNRSLSLVLSFFGDGLGQWLIHRSPNAQDWGKSTFRSTPWLATIACIAMVGLCAMGWYYLQFWFTVALLSALTIGAMYVAERDHSGIWQFLVEMFRPQRDDREPIQKPDGQPVAPAKYEPPSRIGHVADGGFYDYLGVSELFRRKCSLIVVSDAGAHLGDNTLGTLAKMCSHATAKFGVRILDLDHESPIDFGRLEFDQAHENERVVHQPYLVARIRYADDTPGLLVYCQMAITHSDPIEIQQIRNRFPSFPDEPTTNQFYTDDQVAAYRNLGYHIAKRMGSELHRWTAEDLAAFSKPNDRESARCPVAPPLFEVVERRILTAYRLACYQEHSYKSNDLFSEAIWSTKSYECPSFSRTVDSDLIGPECELPMNGQPSGSELSLRTRAENWLRAYEKNGDLRAKYRYAVLGDINSIEDEVTSDAACIYREILQQARQAAERAADERPLSASFERELMAAHLTVIAVACHEIHEGRPNAIFQVGGRKKLLAMTTELAKVLVPVEAEEEIDEGPTDFHPPTINTPTDKATLRSAVKRCIGEIVELEKCTFQGSERVTTVSFAQCLVMMWGQLCRDGRGDLDQELPKGLREIAESIREEGIELAESRVRIWLDKGLRKKNLSHVVSALQKAWCLTYLPLTEIADAATTKRREQTKVKKKGR